MTQHYNDYRAVPAPSVPVTVIPTDSEGRMIKDATRKWDPSSPPRSFEDHLFYCLKRSGTKAHHIDIAGTEGEIMFDLDVGAIQMMREDRKTAPKESVNASLNRAAKVATPKKAKVVKTATPKKVVKEPRVKAPRKARPRKSVDKKIGDGKVGVTLASQSGLPTQVGVFAMIQDTLRSKNPVSDAGWTSDELALLISKHFKRPLAGVKTTVRCQISRKFEADIKIERTREGRVLRYRIK